MRRQILSAAGGIAVFIAASSGMAATVTVNPPAGTATNAIAFVAGEDALAVNTGATGGTVRLSPYNTHTGGTTLGSGTLVVTQPARPEAGIGELGAGPFTQTGGTLRYAGPAGGVWTGAITNRPAVDTSAVVWQIDNDLVMAGDVQQPTGCFIKDGPGTLTFTKPFSLGGCSTKYTGIYNQLTDFSPDRAPTKGYAPFTISDGTVVIDTPAGTTNILSGTDINLAIGQGRTTTGEETTGVLILSNGVTRSAGRINIGSSNGYVSNTGKRPEPTVRIVNGAKLYTGLTGNGGYAFYMGVRWYNGGTQWCSPLLEIDGAGSYLYCKGFSFAYNGGANSTVRVTNGGYLYGLGGEIYSGQSNSNSTTTNLIEVTGDGSWVSCTNFRNDKNNGGMTTTLRLADNGKIEMYNFYNSAKGKLNLIVDGGIWRHRNHSPTDVDPSKADPHFPATMTSIKIGPGGMTTFFNNGREDYPVVWEKGIEPLDDSGTDGGLHITQGSSAMPPLRMNAANTYCGPTEISFTRVYLGKNGSLPSGTALWIYGNYGGLIITNGITQTVGSFAFGRDDTATEGPILGFSKGSSLYVTGEFHAGERLSAPKLHLFETQGGTDGLATPGTYTFVSVRAEDANDLAWAAGQFTFPYKPDSVDYKCFVTQENGRALLKVAVTPAGTPAAVSGDPLIVRAMDGETVSPAAADVAAAHTIYSNPSYQDSGTVELGDLTGFAAGGTLIAGSGTTRISDLSFVQDVTNLAIRTGTLMYTGASATIPGFTMDTAGNRSSVINVADTNITLTITDLGVRGGSLTKMGPGTLHFGGTGEIVMPTEAVNAGAYNGVTANGAGPANGARCVNVNEGKMTIGTLGDPTDAPTLIGPYDFSVGSQSHRIGQGIQTSGELVMNNGALDLVGYLYIGYYSGRYDDCPEIITHPTLTQNGGWIECEGLRLGQANATYPHNCSPCLRVHAGTNNVRTEIYASYYAASDKTCRTEVTVDGTGVLRAGTYFYGGASNSAGVDLTIADNGLMEVSNVVYLAYNNQNATNIFRLTGNGVLRARYISGNNLNRGLKAYFDGGTYESLVNASGNSKLINIQEAYIGAGGLNVDLSHQTELDGPTTYWFLIQQKLMSDPALGGTPDGGITFFGAGTGSVWDGFENSTFTGPIRVRDGARFIPAGSRVAAFTVEASATARLQDYNGTSMLKNLALGTAGSSDPVVLELRRDVKGYGFVVTNELSILSPVAITTHNDGHDLSPYPVDGTYTALVYRAELPDVDLSLFTLTAEDAVTATLSAQQVTVAGGDYDGMKAVVVTIAGATSAGTANGNVWTSATAGGDWSDTANWANAAAGAPNGPTKTATFKPATKASVGVTLDTPVTLGGMTFTAASKANYGYNITGQGLTLDNGAAGSTPAIVANAKGTNIIASAVTLATDAQLQTAKGDELRLTGGVTGTGNLEVNTHVVTNAGQVNLKVLPGYTGKITTGSGRVVIDDLSFIQSPDQLTLGLGTLLYTGPNVEIPGFKFTAASGRPAVFESEADVTVGKIERTGTAAFLKLGTGTLRLHGTDTFSVNTSYNNSGSGSSARFANGDGPTKAVRGFAVSEGTFVVGEVDDPANAPTLDINSREIGVGNYTSPNNSRPTLILNNGTISLTSQFYMSFYSRSGTELTFRMNGGRIVNTGGFYTDYYGTGVTSTHSIKSSLVEINGGTASFDGNLRMGYTAAKTPGTQTSRLVVNGGTLAFGGSAVFAFSPYGRTSDIFIDLNGGLFAVTGTTTFACYPGDKVTLRLNSGGTFRANAITHTNIVDDAKFYGNGGTFQPICKTAAGQTLNAAFCLYSSTNGLVVDTSETLNGAAYTIAMPILHDPDCEGADGGLVKRGRGTMTLSGANTYTGPTVVEGGVLALSGTGSMGTGSALLVARGAICDLGGTAQAVGDVTASGLVRNGALTVGGSFCATDDLLLVDGDFTLASTAAVDFAAVSDVDFTAGVPIAAVFGTATLPGSVRATNASVRGVAFVRDGDVIYAVKAPNGTMMIFR